MNKWIKIGYKPGWYSDPNYWNIWFILNHKEHRKKAPSLVESDGYWSWFDGNWIREDGLDFDWDK